MRRKVARHIDIGSTRKKHALADIDQAREAVRRYREGIEPWMADLKDHAGSVRIDHGDPGRRKIFDLIQVDRVPDIYPPLAFPQLPCKQIPAHY